MKLIAGNWKMHGDPAMAQALAKAVVSFSAGPALPVSIALCPPFVLIPEVVSAVAGSAIAVGAQDCHAEAEGAFTGDVSAAMLKSGGCSYVIVGHSERRTRYGETSDMAQKKASAAIKAGLIPIICVGETGEERRAGKAEEAVARQVKESIPSPIGGGLGWGRELRDFSSNAPLPTSPLRGEGIIIAYEPVWAIGSGKTPTVNAIEAMHAHVLAVAGQQTGLANDRISVLYGGSVKSANAKEILSVEGVAGALVGGASLQGEEFCKIIAAAH